MLKQGSCIQLNQLIQFTFEDYCTQMKKFIGPTWRKISLHYAIHKIITHKQKYMLNITSKQYLSSKFAIGLITETDRVWYEGVEVHVLHTR